MPVIEATYRQLSLPSQIDGVAIAVLSPRGTTTRVSMIRGSRDYILFIDGTKIPATLRFDLVNVIAHLAV